MIKYRLNCAKGHDFEAWFRNSDAHDLQAKRNEIVCPHCGDNDVSKAIMAPAVASRIRNPAAEAAPAPAKPERAAPSLPAEALHVLRELRREVEANSDYVGRQFAEEARKIHYKEAKPRGIHGEASLAEARDLYEEGVSFLPLPVLPEDKN